MDDLEENPLFFGNIHISWCSIHLWRCEPNFWMPRFCIPTRGNFCRISSTIRLSSPPPNHLLKELQFGYMWMWQWTLLRFWYWFASLTWTSIPAKCSPKQTQQTTSTTVQVVLVHQDSFLKWNIGVQSTKTNQLNPVETCPSQHHFCWLNFPGWSHQLTPSHMDRYSLTFETFKLTW